MAKKFVRSITGIKNIKDQDLSTNNVGDLLSDGKDIYVHRKNGAKEEYYNLTNGATNTIADGDSGLEIWQPEGEDNKRIKLSQEFLKNNAQYISAKENSGLKATPRQDKYGKSYELDFTDEAKAKMQDIVDKVNKIPAGGSTTGGGKKIKVAQAPTPISADEPVDVLTVKETDTTVTLGLTNNVLTNANFRGGDDSTLGGDYITLVETTWTDLDENFMDVTRHGWGLHLNENYWASRRNMKTSKGSGILLKEETDLAGLNLNTEDITFDIDSTTLVRHDCLLGDENKGIKVWHTAGQSTSAISLTDDVLAKLAKVDQLSSGTGGTQTVLTSPKGTISLTPSETGYGLDVDNSQVLEHEGLKAGNGVAVTHNEAHTETTVGLDETTTTKLGKIDTLVSAVTALENKQGGKYVGDGDTILVEKDLDNNNVISLNSGLKTKINKVDGFEARISNLEKDDPTVGAGTQKTIKSSDGSVTVTTDETNVDLSVDTSSLYNGIDNKISSTVSSELDKFHTLYEATTVEAPLTKSYNQTENGRTINIGLSELSVNRLNKVDTIETNVTELTEKVTGLQPLFKTYKQDTVRFTVFGIPYGDSNYLATVTIEAVPGDMANPVTLPKGNVFTKYLNSMTWPSSGGYQSGGIVLDKDSTGAIKVLPKINPDAEKVQAQFTMVISKI